MADKKITQLTATSTLASTDILPVVVDPSGTPITKKITIATLLAKLIALWPAVNTFVITDVSAEYDVLTTDEYIRADGTFAVNLPAATGTGQAYIVKNVGSGSVTVTAATSEYIDGDPTRVLAPYELVLLVDGASAVWDAL